MVKVTYRFTNSLSEFLDISFEENVSVSSREAMTRERKELRPNRFCDLLEQVSNPDGLAIISRRHEKSVADFGAKLMPYRLSANEFYTSMRNKLGGKFSFRVEKPENFTKPRAVGRDKARAVIIILRVDRGRSKFFVGGRDVAC